MTEKRVPRAYSQSVSPVETGEFFREVEPEEDTETIPKVREVWDSGLARDALEKAHCARRRSTIAMVFASLALVVVVLAVCICLYLLGQPFSWWLGLSLQCS